MTLGFSNRFLTRFRQSIPDNIVTRLIIINCLVFLLFQLAFLICKWCGFDSHSISQWLCLPASLSAFIWRPWTIITYMFINADLFRLIFNMIWLYCFGRLLLLPLSDRNFFFLYVTGGIVGGLFYMLGATAGWWTGSWLTGPSAAIITIIVATAIRLHQLELNMLIIGNVKVIWVAVCVLIIYFCDIDIENLGGNAAHVGGAVTGVLSILKLPHLTTKKASTKFRTKTRASGDAPNRNIDPRDNERLDMILDKVKRAGYAALTADEKAELFDISRRIK